MSSLRKIVYLANSLKLTERCIAGIDIETGQWLRPICDDLYPNDGRVPKSIRVIQDREPELLDILQIPLAETGNDFGFECENRLVLPGEWMQLGKFQPDQLIPYCQNFQHILHNSSRYVNPSELQHIPR
ncbi:dual OB domain-containing protein [Pseudocalidococcus azoricus]|uniref:dual OB domain-containing protein n=1 Tax=Pseudocalidococcus azoricus TaxID=3110322 RepID=UPI003899CEF2